MKTCIKCSKEINEEMMYCPYCGEKQDRDDFLSDIDNSLNAQVESKVNLENEQEKFKLFDYEKVADDTYIIKRLKNKYVYKVDVPEGVVAICEGAFEGSKVIEVNLPSTLMEIEARAFKDCINLKNINLPNSVSIIGDEAFLNCSKLNLEIKEQIDLGQDVLKGTSTERIKLEQIEQKEAEEKTKEENERKIKEENEKKIIEEKNKILNKRKYEFDKDSFIKNCLFGRYPQTLVTDINTINNLKQISVVNDNGYIEFDGNEYKVYNNAYYLVEPIKWTILEKNGDIYKLVSDLILDQEYFLYVSSSGPSIREVDYRKIYPNDYELSNIRAWLNGYNGKDYRVENYENIGFIDMAFNLSERNIITHTLVDKNTIDKVYLLSYEEVYEKYFKECNLRKANVSDYANNKGIARLNGLKGQFWLRSHSWDAKFDVSIVYFNGDFSSTNSSDDRIGVRPALEIKIK